jgi:hypothetical protein
MTVFEVVSPTVNKPIGSMFSDSNCACKTEESALDRWTNEGGALYESRLVQRHKRLPAPNYSDSEPACVARNQMMRDDEGQPETQHLFLTAAKSS